MASSTYESLLSIIMPKKKAKPTGTSATGTYNPQQAERVLTAPVYTEHLTDIFNSRQSDDSRTLLKNLFRHDPDVSAAVFSYLTLANTEPLILVYDMNGQIDRDATKNLMSALKLLTVPTDYTLGFQLKKSLSSLCEELRYMALLRGGIAAELVLNKQLAPNEIRMVDLQSIQWYEKQAGNYKPRQTVPGISEGVDLDIPTFFVSFFRKSPTDIYSYSPFVASINTIAARQQVINDLYRIMQKTGYPRMDISVVEEVLNKNIPANIRNDPVKVRSWQNDRLSEVRSAFENIRSDQALVHFDSIEPKILNEKNPGVGINIQGVIDTLNAQNQAALKTMSTVIGRGASGVNTGSVEARIAGMNADELNEPVADILTNICSFILHNQGYQGFASVRFKNAELRADLELEPQLLLRSQRLRQDLSDGLITDDEYHLLMYNRLRPDAVAEMMGTNFQNMAAAEATVATQPDQAQAGDVNQNTTSVNRSASSGKATKTTKSNAIKAT